MVEKENFFRFCGVLLDIGAKVLREVFLDKYVRTSTLAGYLACHKQKLTGLLPNTLKKEQFDLLYPPGVGVPVIENLDITLLCFLFRNLDTQITPYDSVWTDPKTHQTYQADVTRIRLVRNMLFGHVKSTLMSNTIFNDEVRNLSVIYLRLVQSLSAGRMSSTELQEMIDRELNDPLQINLDREVKVLQVKMQALYKHDDDFQKAVQKDVKEFSEKQEDMKKDIKDIQERQVIYQRDVTSRNMQDEDFKRAVEASQEEIRKHTKELSVKQEGIKKDIKDIQKQLSEKQEDKKNYMEYLPERQLEKSRQWDSKSRDNEQVTVADMRRRIDYSKEVLDKHRHHADEFFVANEQYRTGKQIIDEHGKILITGNPGQGKTYLAYQLLLKFLEDKNNVSPLIISYADEWVKLVDSSTGLCIVVDDMCGKYGLLKGELKNWNENARFITALIDNRKHTVIFTMRTHIHEETAGGLQLGSDISDPLFSEDITLNLDKSETDDIKLANKIQLANRYLKRFGLTENEVLELCTKKETSIAFPLLCRRAQSIKSKSELFDLFSRPLDIMYRELERFCKDKSIIYGVLVLVMLSGGKLTSESINEYSTIIDKKKELKLIFDSYGGPDVKPADIQPAADALRRTYLLFNESDESYCFIHDTNEEAVFLSYGKLRPQETIKLCSLRSVCKLCRINNESQSSNSQASALMLALRPGHHSILIERFIKALEIKCPEDFSAIAEANVWSSGQFRKLFMDKCKTIHVLADMDQNSLLVHAANTNNSDLAGELLRGMKQIRAENQQQAVSYLTKAARASCVHKDLCLFKQFMKTGNVNGNDILSITVEKDSEDAMVFLLQNGADVNYRSENGESLLHTACIHERLHMVKLLQSKYSLPVNQRDSKGRSVCHSAASGGSVDIFNFLVQEGADPLCTDVKGMNLLHYACLEGKKEMAFHLMGNYTKMLYNVGKGGYTVPHCAAYGGSIDIFNKVCKLMNATSQTDYNRHSEEKEPHRQKQADLKARTQREETLLHMACLNGKLEMTKYLVEKYPGMINEVTKHNASIAHYAVTAKGGDVSVLQYLIDQGLDPWHKTRIGQTLLHSSCAAGQLERTKYLLDKYPNMINEVDNFKGTPAHYAAESSNVPVLQHLIDQGLDPWCRTSKQETMLHVSCLNGHLEMTQYLVAKYPDMINEVDYCKATPAHYAAESSNVSVLQYLIDQGLDPWCRTSKQETLLHASCLNGKLEMTQYLVAKYPNMINEVDNCKETPAHYAAGSSNVSVLQYLIDQGLDPWCRTSTQETLLHKSCLKGQLEMTRYLVAKYPNMINEVDNCNETPAHYAAESSNVSVLQYLIDRGLDPWCRTSTQETLLHKSCLKGQLEMTRYLVAKYPNMINEVNNCKGTPAHYAAQSSNVSVLQYLIDRGLDPWCRTCRQETLLHMSCLNGHLEMTQYLVLKYPNMINEVDYCKATPAHYAAGSSNVSVLQYLIDQGLDPWCRTSTQETLLHKSCLKGQLEMTQYLVTKYPNMINEVNNCKETPAHYAAGSSNVSVLQYLIDSGLDPLCRTSTQRTLLHASCFKGQLEMTQYLVVKYPNMINEVDNCKGTPVHYAAESSNVSVLQYIIDSGLDPWCRTSTQETLLHKSCLNGELEMTQYLVAKYPNMINEVTNCKGTPAHYAAQSSNVSVLQYLIDQGLDPWCRTSKQETLLHKSCLKGQLEMTQYLVAKYPNMINEVDNCNGTPAHYAVQGSNVSVVQYLIDQGLDPWCRTSTQETLLHVSCFNGQLEMTQYLVAKYPNMINEVNNCKGTPAHCVAESSNVFVLQYLIDRGLDPWCRTSTQETLLHRSCFKGQLEMTQYLVAKYPNMINEVNNCKETPAHYAAQSSNVSVLQYLIDQGLDPWCRTCRQETLLHMSCLNGHLEMTQYLVAKYPNMINEVNNCKETPAHYAAQSSNVSVLQYLIDQGLDPWCRTSTQETVLHKACFNGKLEMIQYLVAKYPNMISEVDNCKRTPAHCVALTSSISLLEYMIDQGLDPWCRTATQETLLHESCSAGQLEMTRYLVETYPNLINEVDNCKRTPAFHAACGGNVSLLQYLIDQGLDPWCRTVAQQTLLHGSCFTGRLEMTQYLAKKYPDMVKELDNCNRTPAQYAAHSSNVSVLLYLIDQGLYP